MQSVSSLSATEKCFSSARNFRRHGRRKAAGFPSCQAILHAIQKAGLAGPKLEELIVVLPPDVAKRTPKSPPLRPEEIKRLLEPVIRRGDVIRLKDLLFHRSAIDDLRDRLVAFLRQHREISPTQFKDLVGQSRKYSIPFGGILRRAATHLAGWRPAPSAPSSAYIITSIGRVEFSSIQ